MKYFMISAAIALLLNSCNTSIGLYRDTKQGFIWTKNKIQGASQPSGDYDQGAPVY
jgi:predicted small secreted protein